MTRKALGVVALAVGALLVFAGCVLELYRLDGPSTPGTGGFAFTPWNVDFKSERATPPSTQRSPQWGYALVLAGALAAFAAATQFRSGRLATVGRLASAVAIGLVGATTWAASTTVTTLFGGGREPSPRFHLVVGSGLWTLITACSVLLVGTLLVQDWPALVPRPEGPVVHRVGGHDDDTPPFGIPLPDPAGPPAPDPTGPPAAAPGVDRTSEDHPPTGGNPSTVEQ